MANSYSDMTNEELLEALVSAYYSKSEGMPGGEVYDLLLVLAIGRMQK